MKVTEKSTHEYLLFVAILFHVIEDFFFTCLLACLLELIYNSVQQTLLAVPVPFSKYGLNRFFLALMEIVR